MVDEVQEGPSQQEPIRTDRRRETVRVQEKQRKRRLAFAVIGGVGQSSVSLQGLSTLSQATIKLHPSALGQASMAEPVPVPSVPPTAFCSSPPERLRSDSFLSRSF